MGKTRAEKMAEIEAGIEAAKDDADKLADPMLNSISNQADELRGIFDELKLTDEATYEAIKKIVNSETSKNIAIANIAARVQELGAAGASAATAIAGMTGAGALAALGSVLGKRK
ncbi:MAG TPA: hypothetical protein VGC54_08650 [Planctomycetota bacterium]